MGFFDRFFNKETPPAPRKRRNRVSSKLERLGVSRVRMDMTNLNRAAENALDPNNSDRSTLLDIYERTVKDGQYIAEHDKAVAYLITEPFVITNKKTGKEDQEKTKLLERPWFTNFLKIALDVEFWGYTLLEFQQQDSNGEFLDVIVFPRHHVRPFEKTITKYPDETGGLPYGGTETAWFLLEMGDANVLGKLESISVEMIWKTFARSDWSEYNERYGKPFVIYQTDTDSQTEMDEAFEMAQKFGSDLVGVTGTDEKLDVISVASKEACENFKQMAISCDEYIAKMVNGQTGTSDVKAWAGSAEVHERVLTEFTKSRMKRIQNDINYKLIPFLTAHGYPLNDCEFGFYTLMNKSDNTVDNKSYNADKPSKFNKDNPEDNLLGFFA